MYLNQDNSIHVAKTAETMGVLNVFELVIGRVVAVLSRDHCSRANCWLPTSTVVVKAVLTRPAISQVYIRNRGDAITATDI